MSNPILNIFKKSKIIRITIDANLEQPALSTIKVDQPIPYPAYVGILLQSALGVIGQWAKEDSMLIRSTKPEVTKENGKENSND